MEEDAKVGLIGFGEAATAFVEGAAVPSQRFRAFDIKTDDAATRMQKHADYDRAKVRGAATPAKAVERAGIVLSLVTADQALRAAESVASALLPDAIYCDMNSVAPQTKRAAEAVIAQGAGRYVDVAVMSPVRPQLTATPLLVSGPHAEDAISALKRLGFASVERVEGPVGAASAIKMIRSVMIKGMEALTAECLLAAEAAGVRDSVLASLDASEKPWPWAARANYNLDRMLVHGLRRAAEMEEVVLMLDALGTGSTLSRATIERQRALGGLGLAPPEGLGAKLLAILPPKQEKAA